MFSTSEDLSYICGVIRLYICVGESRTECDGGTEFDTLPFFVNGYTTNKDIYNLFYKHF